MRRKFAILAIITFVLLGLTLTSVESASAQTSVETGALSWAIGQIGSTSYYDLCLTLAQKAYQDGAGFNIEPLTNYGTFNSNTYPQQVWDDGFNSGTTGGSNTTPPYGALVFFNDPSNYTYSHVMVSLGGGNNVSAPDAYNESDVHYETLSEAAHSGAYATYVGWWLPDGTTGGSGPPTNGQRFVESGQTQQYIDWYGASLPLSYGDAQAYNSEGNAQVLTDTTNFLASHPATDLPTDTVVRVVGTPSQYLYTGSQLDPIGAPATSSCLLYSHNQSSPAVVPTMWSDTLHKGGSIQLCIRAKSALLSTGKVGIAYSISLKAAGGNPPYTWSLATGSKPLPSGLKLSSTGVISGKPTKKGTYSFTVKVVDTKTKTKPATQHTATTVLSIAIT